MEGNFEEHEGEHSQKPVHPLEEGNLFLSCLFSSKSKINTKTNFSKLPVRQSSNHRAGLEVILYLRIWRARLCVGLVECPALVRVCQLCAWLLQSSSYWTQLSDPSSLTRARARGEFASLLRVLGISLNGCLRLRG